MGKDDSNENPRPPAPSSSPLNGELTGTVVDLGDDLLEATTVALPKEDFASQPSDSQYASARILINEGLVEDAKKLLRKILLQDSHHAGARQSLQEILDGEMKALLAEQTQIQRPRIFERKGEAARAHQISTEVILRELDEEFGLGLLDEPPPAEEVPQVKADPNGIGARDHIDLGIAFFEMGTPDRAIHHFGAACELLRSAGDSERTLLLSANALLARSYLSAKLSFEATQVLHPFVRDPEISAEEKLEFFYLMGVAQELSKGRKAGLPWFTKVFEIDSHYRDIAEKLRKSR